MNYQQLSKIKIFDFNILHSTHINFYSDFHAHNSYRQLPLTNNMILPAYCSFKLLHLKSLNNVMCINILMDTMDTFAL